MGKGEQTLQSGGVGGGGLERKFTGRGPRSDSDGVQYFRGNADELAPESLSRYRDIKKRKMNRPRCNFFHLSTYSPSRAPPPPPPRRPPPRPGVFVPKERSRPQCGEDGVAQRRKKGRWRWVGWKDGRRRRRGVAVRW